MKEEISTEKTYTGKDVTIIIPCYKQAKFVKEAILSCLSQTMLPKQVIVLLMDPESQILQEEVSKCSPLLRVVTSGRKLLPSARNFCFGLATTEFVIPLDADDTLESNFIEETLKLTTPSISIVYVGAKFFGTSLGSWPPSTDEEVDWDKQTTLRRNPLVCTALIRREAWATVGGYSDTLTAYEDMEFWIHLHEHGFLFKKCTTTWLNYRKHETSSMLKEVAKDSERNKKLREEIISLHPKYYSHIPHILHYVWLGNNPEPTAVIDTWKKHLPGDWEIKKWNETNLDLKSQNVPKILAIAYYARKYGIAVDPIRAQLLYDYGGFWIDADCLLTRDITPFCQFDFIVSYESQKWLNVGLVGTRKGSPIMKEVIDYYKNLRINPSVIYDAPQFVETIGTGPMVLTRTLSKMLGSRWIPNNMPQTFELNEDKIRLEPPNVFVLDDEESNSYNYALHLYSATWIDKNVSWAETVKYSYNKWKKDNNITNWRG